VRPGIDFTAAIAGKGFSTLMALAWIAVMARLYSPEELSFLAQLAIAMSLMETTKGFGLGSLLVRRLPAMESGSSAGERLQGSYLFATGGLLGIVAAAGLLAGPAPWKWGLMGACFQSLAGSWTLILQAGSRFIEASINNIALAVASRAIPAAAAWLFHLSLVEMLQLTAALTGVLAAAVLVNPVARTLRSGWGVTPMAELWPEAKHYFYSGWLRYGATQLDQIFAAMLLPAYSLAVYFVFRRVYSLAVLIIDAGVEVLTPRLIQAAASGPHRPEMLVTAVLRSAVPLMLAVMTVAAWKREFLAVALFGVGYAQHADLVMWLLAAALAYGLYSMNLCGTMATGDAPRFARLVALSAITNTVIATACSPWMGIISLPLAMSAGYTVTIWSANGGTFSRRTSKPVHSWSVVAILVSLLASAGFSHTVTWEIRSATAGCAVVSLIAAVRSLRIPVREDL
jgi:O-antigen/teichoic acid export membrane protein